VLSDSNKVQMKIIQPGSFYKDAYLVLDGLNAKDKIAMGGTALLKNGSVVIPKPTPWEAGGDSPKSSPK
jgi:membrane fusion protein (multidrug efflux system)